MKILFICGNLTDGGAQRVISVVASNLAKVGYDVNLLLYSRNENEYPISELVNVYSLADSFEEYKKINTFTRIKKVRCILKKMEPDIAIGFLEGGYGLFISSIGLKMKKIASSRIYPVQLLKAKGLRAFIDRLWFKHADAVVVQTNGQRESAKNAGWKNVTVIENPISDELLVAPKHNYSRDLKRIIMIGRLSEQKNYDMAIRAIRELRNDGYDVNLDIYGKGAEEGRLIALINELGLEDYVILKGWQQNVSSSCSEYDAFLLTSNYEGMPNALMEAMAMGLPCISTNCATGPSDLITDNENGILVEVGDVKSLVEKLELLIDSNLSYREKLGKNAHDSISENNNPKTITSKWLDLFVKM